MADDYETYDVFLSYSHRDEHIAKELAERFRLAGIKFFMAAKDLVPGDNWEWARQTGMCFRAINKYLMSLKPSSLASFAMFWIQPAENGSPDFYGYRQPTAVLSPWADPKARQRPNARKGK